MRFLIIPAAAALAILAAPAAQAGCLTGAAVGGVAGHMAGHGALGAGAGCVAGHEHSKHATAARRASDQQPSAGAQQQPAGNSSGTAQQ